MDATITPEGRKLIDSIIGGFEAKIRAEERERCAKLVPTNWCDPLLTGKDVPKLPLGTRGVETLLRGIQDRIRGS